MHAIVGTAGILPMRPRHPFAEMDKERVRLEARKSQIASAAANPVARGIPIGTRGGLPSFPVGIQNKAILGQGGQY